MTRHALPLDRYPLWSGSFLRRQSGSPCPERQGEFTRFACGTCTRHLYGFSRKSRETGAYSFLYSVYSPAHAVWWAVAGSLGMSVWASWLVTFFVMALFSAQSYMLAREYSAHVKDRQVLSGEMLREYDEKVCDCNKNMLMIAFSLSCHVLCPLFAMHRQ